MFLPPEDEQVSIQESQEDETKRIDDHIARQIRGIALFGEFRARLISDVVTGKLDVREAAASVPEDDWLDGDNLAADALHNGIEESDAELHPPHP